jgi:NADPH:quinone reductase-like Zn-dependent oxidoreductase
MAATEGKGATFVLELVGRPTLQASLGMLAADGRIVCAGTLGGDVAQINVMDLIMKRGRVIGSFGKIPPQEYDDIFRLFATETFRPVIDCVMPLRDAKLAHERIEARQAFGKVVLVP